MCVIGPLLLREEHRLRMLRRIFGTKKKKFQNTKEIQNDEPHGYIRPYIHTYKHMNTYIYIYIYNISSHSINPNVCQNESEMWNVKEMGGACGTRKGGKRCVQLFGGKT